MAFNLPRFVFLWFLLINVQASGLLQIPQGMTAGDRIKALQIFGYGSASKILDDPYPLGGYTGLELGISTEYLPTTAVATMGSGATSQAQTNYLDLTLGKGIYNNLDTFISFTPMGQRENITNIAGQVRWGFFQASYLPIYLSLIIHGNTLNCQDLIVTNTVGFDFIAGFKEGNLTLYFGGGPLRASGNFAGGVGGITDTGQTMGTALADSRFLTGINYKMGKYFLAGEIDSYIVTIYSGKLGYRF